MLLVTCDTAIGVIKVFHQSATIIKYIHAECLNRTNITSSITALSLSLSSVHRIDDEVHEIGYSGVNTWVAGFCASVTQDKRIFEFVPPFVRHVI